MADRKDLEEDVLLMRRVAEGDTAAYQALVDTHLRSILSYGQRLLKSLPEAEEVAQETFFRAWEHANSYRPEARVSTWLHTIAHNQCVDRLRKKRLVSVGEALDEVPDSEKKPSVLVERKELAQKVQRALDQLPERQRVALTLVHYQGLSHAEAGEVLGVGVEAVESLLARARRALKQELLSTQRESEPEPK